MGNQIVTHLGQPLNWVAYKNGHNELVLVFTLNGAAFDITDYAFQVNFKTLSGSANKLELKESDFLTNGGVDGRLTIPLTKSQSSIELPRTEYFMEIVYTYNTKEYPLLQGNITLATGRNPASSTTTSIPISVVLGSGSTVNIAVSLPGSGDPGAV